jgi:GH24 family phage-related lysozyme (muramidase)
MSDQMTREQWLAAVRDRIGDDEGDSAKEYRDSMGIPTIGEGFNLERSDARQALAACGVTDVDGVMNGTVALTPAQDATLFNYSFAPIESEARASLDAGIYDALSDARRFVICDLVYNLGAAGWTAFTGTRSAIAQAQLAKNIGAADAHDLFEAAADHLANSAWFTQVGNRARRDVAMMRSGTWVNPTGDGTY